MYRKLEDSQHLRGRRGLGNWEILFLRIQNTGGWMEKEVAVDVDSRILELGFCHIAVLRRKAYLYYFEKFYH